MTELEALRNVAEAARNFYNLAEPKNRKGEEAEHALMKAFGVLASLSQPTPPSNEGVLVRRLEEIKLLELLDYTLKQVPVPRHAAVASAMSLVQTRQIILGAVPGPVNPFFEALPPQPSAEAFPPKLIGSHEGCSYLGTPGHVCNKCGQYVPSAEAEWRPIATAPKGKWVLLQLAPDKFGNVRQVVAHHAHGGGDEQPSFGPGWFIWYGGINREIDDENPTHWMPLPEGPK